MKQPQTDNAVTTQLEEITIKVDPKQVIMRIDKFLMDRLEKVTRSKVQQAITDGDIRLDGECIKPNCKIKPGQIISVKLARSKGGMKYVKGEQMDLDIRYEDDDLLVVYKPNGLVVHPGIGNHGGTLVNGLVNYFSKTELPLMEGNDIDRPGLVHRIDKDTTGLMVIAKNEVAMQHLAKQFFDHTIERTYQALVWGGPEEKEGTITGHIGRHPKERMQMTVYEDAEHGKYAVTHYKVLEDMYYVSLVECKLETGRTHQIRVHMKHIGHTLFNDSRYGGDRILKGTVYSKYKQFVMNTFTLIPRTALHAKTLGFVHPRSGEKMQFDTDLPEDMQIVLDRWRAYVASRKSFE